VLQVHALDYSREDQRPRGKCQLSLHFLTPHTELASQVLCNLPALEAALLTDTALENLPAGTPELPAFEI